MTVFFGAVVFLNPDTIESQRLRQLCPFQSVVIGFELAILLPWSKDRYLGIDAEFHIPFPCRLGQYLSHISGESTKVSYTNLTLKETLFPVIGIISMALCSVNHCLSAQGGTDYPHSDASFGVVDELKKNIKTLPREDQKTILGESGIKLYNLS